MDAEYSVGLVKDFPVLASSADEWFRILMGSINLVRHPELDEGSGLFGALSDFILQMKISNRPLLKLLKLRAIIIGDQIVFDAFLSKSTLEGLCRILPNPFLNIICKMKHSSNPSERATFETRLGLKDMVQEPTYNPHRRLFCSKDSMDRNVTFDINIGWVAPSSDVAMKMNAATFAHNLFARESSKDLVIVAGNGAELSEVLAAMLSGENGMKESISGRVELTENSEEGIRHLVRYLYGMELNSRDIPCDVGVELFKTSHKYKLTELQDYLGKVFLKKGQDWFGPDDLLELYFHVKNITDLGELSEHLLAIMGSLNLEIRKCERFAEIQETDPKAATELVWKLYDMVKKN